MSLLKSKSNKYSSQLNSRIYLAVSWLLLLTCFLRANPVRLEINTSFFYPSEKAFREIYGQGPRCGLDIGLNLWKKLELHVEGNYFFKKGKLTFSQEETTLKLVPVGLNIRWVFLQKSINLYGGIGVIYILFEEKNPIGKVKEDKFGPTAKIGCFKRIKGWGKLIKTFVIDVYLSYHYCPMQPAQIKFDAGGTDFGLGLGFEF